MPRFNNSGNRSGISNTLLLAVVAAVALVVAVIANKGSAPQPQAVLPATGVPAGLDQNKFASDSRLARMTSEAERATGAAQQATANGQSRYSDGLMRRAEHTTNLLQMAKIENQLEESKDQLTELAAKYPDNEKVAYTLDAITIAEDAAEDALDPRQSEPTPLPSKWHQPSQTTMIVVSLAFIAIGWAIDKAKRQHAALMEEAERKQKAAKAAAAKAAEEAAAVQEKENRQHAALMEEAERKQKAAKAAAKAKKDAAKAKEDGGVWHRGPWYAQQPWQDDIDDSIKHGDIAAVRRLIEEGVDSKILQAVEYAFANFDAHNFKTTPHHTMCVLLLEAGVVDINLEWSWGESGQDGTLLHDAAFKGDAEICALLIENGADVNANGGGSTPLHACADGMDCKCGWVDRETAAVLIEKGADVNAKDPNEQTPLHVFAAIGDTETCALLIDKGADVNAVEGWFGGTPLYSCLRGMRRHREHILPTCALLIDKGADVHSNILGTLNEKHVDRVDAETCALLIDNGADVNYEGVLHRFAKKITEPDPDGGTEWSIDERHRNLAVCAVLIEKGADVNAKDEQGKTPLCHLDERGVSEIRALLIDKELI